MIDLIIPKDIRATIIVNVQPKETFNLSKNCTELLEVQVWLNPNIKSEDVIFKGGRLNNNKNHTRGRGVSKMGKRS